MEKTILEEYKITVCPRCLAEPVVNITSVGMTITCPVCGHGVSHKSSSYHCILNWKYINNMLCGDHAIYMKCDNPDILFR